MNKLIETENSYMQELKSLLQDKFFMLLLGVSVAIVVLSSVYSWLKPASTEMASGESTEAVATASAQTESTDTLAGLPDDAPTVTPPQSEASQDTSLSNKIKAMLKGDSKESKVDKEKADDVTQKGATTGSRTYAVKAGDNLWSIAEAQTGSGHNFMTLAAANKIENADVIEVGQKITIPVITAKMPPTGGAITDEAVMTQRQDTAPATHTAKDGDSLWTISTQYYGNGYEWSRIAQLNSLSNPDYIQVGQVIRLKE